MKPKPKPIPKWTHHLSEEFISDGGKKHQNYQYPPEKQLDFDLYITGVLVHPDPYYNHAFQFVFNDGSRTEVDASNLEGVTWVLKQVPEGSVIKRYELMQNQTNSCLHGFKFLDKRGKVLLTAGDIDDPNARESSLIRVKEFVIREDERLCGVKSGQRKCRDARHYDF